MSITMRSFIEKCREFWEPLIGLKSKMLLGIESSDGNGSPGTNVNIVLNSKWLHSYCSLPMLIFANI
jgi:hypothetical protein